MSPIAFFNKSKYKIIPVAVHILHRSAIGRDNFFRKCAELCWVPYPTQTIYSPNLAQLVN
eukprot:scaffold67605_cov19-Prasinocladus_malaysianus.AAC.1